MMKFNLTLRGLFLKSIVTIIQIILIVLKLTGVITWPWIWILAPAWIFILLILIAIAFVTYVFIK